ncbi:hypothetical protein [uncultured Bacteroides sp.]|uniref:hypothetical protein n=1 Tax=uncultured Bacteroides sp. TaxID=162156 RepID=UPI0026323507|nr:hypothetical protein [uncultured Bacteroides sp.]
MYKHNDRLDNPIKTLVILCETCLCGTVFYLFYHMSIFAGKEVVLHTSIPKIMIILMLCYPACSFTRGVILHHRKSNPYRIILRTFGNIVFFGIMSVILLRIGNYMELNTMFYPTYLSVTFLTFCTFRLVTRGIIRGIRTRGGNLRFVILVGSAENNARLYHELTDDPSMGFRVEGYFDDAPNPHFPKGCRYLGTPQSVNNYLNSHQNIHYLFCSLPSQQSDTIVKLIDYCENHIVHFYSVPTSPSYASRDIDFYTMGNVPCLSLRTGQKNRLHSNFLQQLQHILFFFW